MTHDPTDDVLKDLEAALTVKPSSAFAAGVRARIRDGSARRRVWPRWTMAGLAAAAAVVLAVLAWPQRGAPRGVAISASRPPAPAAPAPAVAAISSPAAPIAVPGPSRAIAKPLPPRSRSVRAAVSEPPEVLVPRDQAVALQALVTGLSDGTIDAESLATPPSDASTPLPAAAQIVIVPIVIPAIDVRPSAGGTVGGIR